MASPLDIYGSEQTLISKDRAFRIEIDNVYGYPISKKYINYHQETLILNGEDGPKVGKAAQSPTSISVDFDNAMTKTYTFTDPVTGQEVTISIAGIAIAINMDYVVRRTYQIAYEAYLTEKVAYDQALIVYQSAVSSLDQQLATGIIDQDGYDTALAALEEPVVPEEPVAP